MIDVKSIWPGLCQQFVRNNNLGVVPKTHPISDSISRSGVFLEHGTQSIFLYGQALIAYNT